ncbi:TPR repeat-containing protein YrrB [Sporomusa ovata DSM 2662]|uniref:FOG: TPR repeat n=1 Tax=Sporomusa ovata TaxID=2378 RepID=A0A0U1L6A7_9FIRM|nr:tetratricopeptide repeat-containing glycosyltransferase family protein [Sporomusa ovata]EQB28485.1 protein FlbA [Sporomusa ovata DSM 2662]CQR74809.1 FOG: TPR repeat [Sporomusa ovata]
MSESPSSEAQQQLLLGNVCKEQGLLEDAIQCYQAGVTLCPGSAELWFALGTTLLEVARLPEAVAALQQASALQPDSAGVYMNLGNAFNEQGRCEDAIQCFQKGLAICPGNAALWFNLGVAFSSLPRLSEAVAAFQQAITLQPDFPNAYLCLGSVLKEQGLYEAAVQCYQKGLVICPGDAQLWFNLGTTLLELRSLSEAAAALQQAITLQPDLAAAYNNLGNVLLKLQRLSEAVAMLQQAIALKPDYSDAYINMGNVLQAQGKIEYAIDAYNRAIALNPSNLEVYYNRATAILLNGNLSHGFAEYEWRMKIPRFHHFYEWFDAKPRWSGENFAGKRLLVYDEQGFGDSLQFCRYLPLVKARGGSVQFSTKPPLLRLFANFPGIDELIEHTAATIAQAQFDLTVPLVSLPYIFGTTLHTIPAGVPYLNVEQHSKDVWRKRMTSQGSQRRVGLVWAGNPANISGQIRTCGLQTMTPLAYIPGVTFYSLQKGEAAQQANTPPGMKLIDLTDDIADFADTAALIMNLDLVISVDTAVAHLAGALGKPVWMLLPAANEWRWLLARNDTPWYPTMRLFRQAASGDWNSVMAAVARELSMWQAGGTV